MIAKHRHGVKSGFYFNPEAENIFSREITSLLALSYQSEVLHFKSLLNSHKKGKKIFLKSRGIKKFIKKGKKILF